VNPALPEWAKAVLRETAVGLQACPRPSQTTPARCAPCRIALMLRAAL